MRDNKAFGSEASNAAASRPRASTSHRPRRVELVRATLDAVPDAVIVVDADGTILTANVQVAPVFGYLPSELEGRPVEMLVPVHVRERHPSIRSGYGRRPMGLLQLSAVRKGGAEFPAEISLAPISTDDETFTVATVRDITERLRLEEEAERIRDELLATVTHELRTPLTSIIGYAEIMSDLGEDELGPAARRLLAPIRSNADRELRLVRDLLFLAVGSLGQMRLMPENVDLGAVLHEVADETRSQADARGIGVEVRLRDAHLTSLADRLRVRQVLDNLVSNALKFTPAGGTITLGGHALADSAILTVSDTGSGVDRDEQERVFDRLFRARNATTSVVPGAGLGLSIAKSIVDAHRGTISLSSEPGAGTTVTIQLPRAGTPPH